jgi:hypothetical protein
MIVKTKTYSELIRLEKYMDRYQYLMLSGRVGQETFGYERFLNQSLYKSYEWRSVRDEVIVRDHGCDLGMEGYEIYGSIIVHHMNPITMDDIQNRNEDIFNPEYLVSTSFSTHNAIHYGDEGLLITEPIIRTKNDTCPWKN